MSSPPIRIEVTKPLILAGRNGTYKIGPDRRIKTQWTEFMKDFGMIEGQVGFRAYGVCHSFDGNGQMDYLCGVEVADAGRVPNYLFTLTIPSRKTAVFIHQGDVAEMAVTWQKIFTEWLPAANLIVAPGPQFETYGEDESTPVEICIPVK
jgi:AraC family transcriptional regulator